MPKKAKTFFGTAVQTWDAEFYVKVDDNIDLDLGMDFYTQFCPSNQCYKLISFSSTQQKG